MEQTIRKQQSELAALIAQNSSADGVHATAIERLFMIRSSQPTVPLHALHEPALCIVAQGKKQVMLAAKLDVPANQPAKPGLSINPVSPQLLDFCKPHTRDWKS